MSGVAACNSGATTNKALRADEEAGYYGAATGEAACGGVGATAACDSAAAG